MPETLPEDVLEKMHAAPKSSHPIIKVEDLPKADGFVFGMPTRFGLMPAQMKAFFDATGGHWQAGALAGKPASLFFSTASQGGGQETTAMTTVTTLTHHGTYGVARCHQHAPRLAASPACVRAARPHTSQVLALFILRLSALGAAFARHNRVRLRRRGAV